MKKITLFLITITLLSIINIKEVSAQTSFYEGDYIPNIWMNKKNPNDGLIYYNQARFIKEKNTNKIAYCIEPFIYFNSSGIYNGSTTPTNYTQQQIQMMTLIAHFGYGYKNHTEPKWYAVTQMMIWQISEPTATYYFSLYKNGPATNAFDKEINEIQSLVQEYQKDTSFHNQIYTIVANQTFKKQDTNQVLSTYKTTEPTIEIENNTITIPALSIGTHTFKLEKNSIIYNRPILFYQSSTNQDIIDVGDPESKTNIFKINVIETTVNINKLDQDNLNNTPQGDGILSNSVFSLYTSNNTLIQSISLSENSKAQIKNLNFGTYYLKETTPGTGYKLNNKKYYFTISPTQSNITINITNTVIKGKLRIIKEYGYNDHFQPEPNISFNIYDKSNNLIKTITTDEQGIAEITLPYGKYSLVQLTTTEGYQKIEPQYFEITSDEELIIKNFKNYKIEVPNTKTESFLIKIIQLIKELLCTEKLYI